MYNLLKDDAGTLDRVGGLFKALTGLGTLFLGLRWLKNPTRIITDFGNVLIFFYNNLIKGRRGLLGRAGALGLLAAGGFAAYKMYNYMKDGEKPTQLEEGEEPEEPQQQLARGGAIKLPQKAMGGWINGPQSGYPVSLDGGDRPRLSDTDVSMLLERAMGELSSFLLILLEQKRNLT